jgi:RHS repeat-associated protein
MQGISDKAIKTNYAENKHRFNLGSELQNKEFSDGSGLELYTTNYRMYDPQIGRFGQVDPLSDISENVSPYAYASNDPILENDPFGLKDTTINGESIQRDKDLAPVTVTPQKKNNLSSLLPLLQTRMATDHARTVTPRLLQNLQFISAEEANKGLSEPAYMKGTRVTQYRTTMIQKFIRVFNPKNTNSNSAGRWMMKESEIQGLSPEQIQQQFSLPGENAPTEMVEVEVPVGTLMQVGYAGTNSFGTGGGVQFEAMETLPTSSFSAPTALPVPSVPMEMPGVEFPEEPIIPEGEFFP